jgi:hypothetical protein
MAKMKNKKYKITIFYDEIIEAQNEQEAIEIFWAKKDINTNLDFIAQVKELKISKLKTDKHYPRGNV